jgi:hypothetical protein
VRGAGYEHRNFEEVMHMGDGHIHVLKQDNAWVVHIEGLERNRSTHRTQAEAIQAGRQAAQKANTELLVHGRDGAIRSRDSYGPDPRHRPG